jgi:aspartyl-tRNA(Asn)/glutamyl-tRNA(Gln) amidotransferase subunit C
MKIASGDVRYVAELANLELDEQEAVRLEGELNAIIEYVDHLAQVNTDGVEPMTQVIAVSEQGETPMRDDQPRPSLERTAALGNASDATEQFFRVPKVIER